MHKAAANTLVSSSPHEDIEVGATIQNVVTNILEDVSEEDSDVMPDVETSAEQETSHANPEVVSTPVSANQTGSATTILDEMPPKKLDVPEGEKEHEDVEMEDQDLEEEGSEEEARDPPMTTSHEEKGKDIIE